MMEFQSTGNGRKLLKDVTRIANALERIASALEAKKEKVATESSDEALAKWHKYAADEAAHRLICQELADKD